MGVMTKVIGKSEKIPLQKLPTMTTTTTIVGNRHDCVCVKRNRTTEPIRDKRILFDVRCTCVQESIRPLVFPPKQVPLCILAFTQQSFKFGTDLDEACRWLRCRRCSCCSYCSCTPCLSLSLSLSPSCRLLLLYRLLFVLLYRPLLLLLLFLSMLLSMLLDLVYELFVLPWCLGNESRFIVLGLDVVVGLAEDVRNDMRR